VSELGRVGEGNRIYELQGNKSKKGTSGEGDHG